MDVRLLGPLEVVGGDDRRAPLPGVKLRAVVILLALDAGSVVSSDRLVEFLYGDDLPARPANALQLLVSKLRRALGQVQPGGERLVVTQAPGYVLDVDRDQVDAFRFERLVAEGRRLLDDRPEDATTVLRQALSLWRGEALADVAYLDVVAVQRRRLEELRLEALEDRIGADLAVGAHLHVVPELEQHTAAHPLRERLWAHLMVALYRGGRQADALRVYQKARVHLADELGLEPGPALRRLEAAVLAQDPSLDPVVRAAHRPPPRSAPAGNLPLALGELVGRKQELADLRLLLGLHRLVTIVGPGGAGKTRLAIEVGRELAEQVADGVWLVELAPVEAGSVVATVAAVLGVDQTGGERAGIARQLSDRELLLVLDNCEHVLDDAARLVHDLLARAPTARVLATSREALGVAGEHRYVLPPLDLHAAVELFAERVQAAGGPVMLTDEIGRQQAFDICTRLDGLPLAVELAASRAAHLDAAAVAARLDDRFRLLTGGLRTADPRQRTLRAVVDWSWDLLDDQERLVFRRFSVFAGSASLEAAEQVCAGAGVMVEDVAGLLARLAGKSLLQLDRSGTRSRFRILQTLADYGRERLAEAEEHDTVHHRHARWIGDLVARAEAGLRGADQRSWLARLAAEVDNVRAAAAWAVDHEPPLALAIAGDLGWFCYMTDQAEMGWALLEAALDATAGASPARARALAFAATLGKMSGHLDQAATFAASAEATVPADAPPAVLGTTLAILALADVQCSVVGPARAGLERARACFAAADDRWWLGYVDLAEAILALYEGRAADAIALIDCSVAAMRSLGDDWMALMASIPRAYVAERQGLLDDAAAALEEGLTQAEALATAIARWPVRLPVVVIARARLALIRAAQDRGEEAVRLADQAVEEARLGTRTGRAIAHQARGRALVGLGRRGEGRSELDRAARLFHDLGVGTAAAECLVDLGRSWLADGDASVAVTCLDRARAEALGTEDRHTTTLVLRALADAYAAVGDAAAAAEARVQAEAGS